MTTDLAWFKANPSSNYRVRDAAPGEVDELARTLLPAGVQWDGAVALPPELSRARVMVVKLAVRRFARMLAAAPADSVGDGCIVPVILGARVALD